MNQKLSIYNTLSRKKELFEPLHPPFVGLYVCGPTVYSDVHLGNVRTFLTFDIVYRYLLFTGYKVRYVRNITDVGHLLNDADSGEDKIGRKARLENLDPMEIVQKYTNGFHSVMHTFNILSPSIEPTATGHIIDQIEMVERILKKGFAYEKNGSVYFDVLKYSESHDYGQLSGRKIEDLQSNSRELEGQDEKNNALDFAIWKNAGEEHAMRWNSPWGQGFPGWHLECSVMSTKYLGEQFDIHGGGMDLKFPHHECEIAQSVAADGVDPVRYWIHGNMLTVNGRKMAKSEGNGFTPEELISGNHKLLEKGYSPMTVRFFMLQGHYASTLDFSNEALQAAEKGYDRMITAYKLLSELKSGEKSSFNVTDLRESCYKAMNDDFNTPILISRLFEGVKWINQIKSGDASLTQDDLNFLKKLFEEFLFEVLGFKIEEEKDSGKSGELQNGLIKTLIALRISAKNNKDFATADQIRNELTKLGVTLKDTSEGTEFSIAKEV